MFLSLSAFCALNAKDKCAADENMVWVAANDECVPKNACEAENNRYCSFYQPKTVSDSKLYTALLKLYAKVKYGVSDCKFEKISDIHFACASEGHYVVFISDKDIQEKEPDAEKNDGNAQKENKPIIQITAFNEKNIKKELNNTLIEVCKIIGGTPSNELLHPDTKSLTYGLSGSCVRTLDSKCESVGGMNTYNFGEKICDLYDIQDILNIKIEKRQY